MRHISSLSPHLLTAWAVAGPPFESRYWREVLAGAHVCRHVAGWLAGWLRQRWALQLAKDTTRPTPRLAQPPSTFLSSGLPSNPKAGRKTSHLLSTQLRDRKKRGTATGTESRPALSILWFRDVCLSQRNVGAVYSPPRPATVFIVQPFPVL